MPFASWVLYSSKPFKIQESGLLPGFFMGGSDIITLFSAHFCKNNNNNKKSSLQGWANSPNISILGCKTSLDMPSEWYLILKHSITSHLSLCHRFSKPVFF